MVVLGVLSLAMPAVAQEPIKEGGVLTGTLRLATRHPNGTKIEADQVVAFPRNAGWR